MAGRKCLAPRYYGQRAVFASLRALFSLYLCLCVHVCGVCACVASACCVLYEFLPRDAMRKRGHCYGPVSVSVVCLSVRLSVMFVHSIQMAEDIVKLLCQPGSPIILVV